MYIDTKNVIVDEVNRKTSVEILKSEQITEGVTTQFIWQWAPEFRVFKNAV